MTGQSSLSQQGGCKPGPSHSLCLSMLCCPSSGFPISQEVLSHFLMSPFQWAEVQGYPSFPLTHRLWNSNSVLPFSFTPGFINCTDPRGGCQGSCHLPGGSWKDLKPQPSHLFSSTCQQSQSFLHVSTQTLTALGFSFCLLSSPPPCRSIPHHLLTQGSTRLPHCSCFSMRNLQDEPQKDKPSKNEPSRLATQTHRQVGPESLSLEKPLCLWQATLCSSLEQWAKKNLSNTTEEKLFVRKSQVNRMCRYQWNPLSKPSAR